ncbi:uncharacterized protein KGF55_003792 [Candida pseudojiufengensis]|uniref:uncharacterized protein n=1 Tax=Candida pseudojiufengensis TaxID=497109 RepID=UPI0022257EA6|nr:uncharacterized protein KGF55_003792 [Candida pseudojiufengensis]KAI5961821.1 hypothetical protein KGF55_003792 [Candida pseudojiufengensis]
MSIIEADQEKIILHPKPGFVVKTKILESKNNEEILTKVFINICHDSQVPKPQIDFEPEVVFPLIIENQWEIPIVVSKVKQSKDKKGFPSLVYDCCINSQCFQWCQLNKDLRLIVIEWCIESVEMINSITLERDYSLPKMLSKGELSETEITKDELNDVGFKKLNDLKQNETLGVLEELNSLDDIEMADGEELPDLFNRGSSNSKKNLIEEIDYVPKKRIDTVEEKPREPINFTIQFKKLIDDNEYSLCVIFESDSSDYMLELSYENASLLITSVSDRRFSQGRQLSIPLPPDLDVKLHNIQLNIINEKISSISTTRLDEPEEIIFIMSAVERLIDESNNSYGTIDEIQSKNPHSFWKEINVISKATVPLTITFFLQYIFSITSLIAAGKLGPVALGASSLALTTFNISGLAIFQGLASSLDSFCPQAYGAGLITGVGLYFQRCTLIMFAFMAPLLLFWWYSGSFLGLFVSDTELVQLAQNFLRWHILGVPGLIFFESGKRFLQAQHIFHAGTYILIIAVPVNIFLNWYLVISPYGLGYIGVPITISITYWTISLLMFGFVYFIDGMQCWGGFTKQALQKWGPMLRISIFGAIMAVSEFLAFEILVLFSANFADPAAKVSAQAIVSNLASLFYQVTFATSVVINTRIGNYIGKNDIEGAILDTKVLFACAPVLGLINCSIFILGRYKLAKLFTDDDLVLKLAIGLNILAGINQIGDSFNVLATGVLRGQGRQKIGSILNCFCFYVIAIPLGYILAFKFNFELNGLWYGLIIGVLCLAASQAGFILTSDWKSIVIASHNMHDAH